MDTTILNKVLEGRREAILQSWTIQLQEQSKNYSGQLSATDLQPQVQELLSILAEGTATGSSSSSDQTWNEARDYLESTTRTFVAKGATAADVARFVLSMKQPLFESLQTAYASEPEVFAGAVQASNELLDGLAIFAITAYQRRREDVISRQQLELLELSTPVVKLWQGILALPLIGTLDSARTQVVMESLLQRVVEVEAEIVIIDITGVPTVDTLVAQHLLKAVTALRMMGAECIISGIRPQIAQTIVHLGVDLGGVTTKATLADALSIALKKTGHTFVKGD